MGVGTALAVTAAVGAVAGGVSTQRQAETGRRAETRQKGIIKATQDRQSAQAAALSAQELEVSQRVGARLRSTAGRRAGRRSLITGSELGVNTTLG